MGAMSEFSVRNKSEAVVDADRGAIWEALTDPGLLAHLTPYLREIDAHGDRWTWHLLRVPLFASAVSPSFTEIMTFEEPRAITFTHDPNHPDEDAGVEGRYLLKSRGRKTSLSIDLAVTVDLPLPHLARPAVQTAMRAVVATMGQRFSSNLMRHLRESG